MKTTSLFFMLFIVLSSFSEKKDITTDNISFFDGATFTLEYFLDNNVQVDLVLTDNHGNSRSVPKVAFTFNPSINQLEVDIYGYCNTTSVKYTDNETYFEVTNVGGITLADCGSDELTDFFEPLWGSLNSQQPVQNVHYEITTDQNGLWLWINESHKLYFSKNTLSIKEEAFNNAITIYPNPVKNDVNIIIKGTSFFISEIILVDVHGKEIFKKTTHLNSIDVSSISSGVYFVKIKNTNHTIITRKLLIE